MVGFEAKCEVEINGVEVDLDVGKIGERER